jgi:hypothetical protein
LFGLFGEQLLACCRVLILLVRVAVLDVFAVLDVLLV